MIKAALKRILMDYEDEQIENGNEEFDIYLEVQTELGKGYTEATLRKWLTPNNGELPKPNQLVTLSKFVKKRHAIDVTVRWLQAQAEGLK